MQNPGDLRVPKGVVIEPSCRTLILNGCAELTDPDLFDLIVELFPNGKPSREDEDSVLEETTYGR